MSNAAGRPSEFTTGFSKVEGSVSSSLWIHRPSVNEIIHSSKIHQVLWPPASKMVPNADSSHHNEQASGPVSPPDMAETGGGRGGDFHNHARRLELESGGDCTTWCKYLKNPTELCTLKGRILWYVNLS